MKIRIIALIIMASLGLSYMYMINPVSNGYIKINRDLSTYTQVGKLLYYLENDMRVLHWE